MTRRRSMLVAVRPGGWFCLGLALTAAVFILACLPGGGSLHRSSVFHAASAGEGQSSPAPSATMTPALTAATAIVPEPGAVTDTIDFGVIAAGGSARKSFRIANESGSVIEVTTIRTSCDCLSIDLAEHLIGPHEAVAVDATIDLSNEFEFAGGLCPEAEFLNASGQTLFVRAFRASVIAPGEPPQ